MARGDALAAGALSLALLAVTVVSWQRWGNPAFDAGFDLTTADQVARGAIPYEDLRYFYGPAGLYLLVAAFKVFGTSLTVAFALGYARTLAILVVFYVLARRWLGWLPAALATAVMIGIAFSGTFFDFVLPHTQDGPTGTLFLLLEVLALTRRRRVWAGLAAGVVCLTRPEFILFAAAAPVGAALGTLRESGWREALRTLVTIAVPAVLVVVPVLAYFAARAGLHNLLFENIFPVDFVRVSGNRLQGGWAPFDVSSAFAVGLRAVAFLGPAAGFVVTVDRWRRRREEGVWHALWPLAAGIAAPLALDGLLHLTGAFPTARHNVEQEAKRLLIVTSWLPAGVLAVAYLTGRAGWRRQAPLGIGWEADGALVLCALACALRAYNAFSFDSYAPYYTALPLLVVVIAADRLARSRTARTAVLVVIAVCALGLAGRGAHLFGHRDYTVHTPRGSYKALSAAGPGIQGAVDYVVANSPSRAPIVVFPDDPGLYFFADRTSALYETTFVPGTLDTVADERKAVRRLMRVRPPLIVVGAQRFDQYAFARFGVDFNRVLFAYVRGAYVPVATFGDVRHPTRQSEPARAFTIYRRR